VISISWTTWLYRRPVKVEFNFVKNPCVDEFAMDENRVLVPVETRRLYAFRPFEDKLVPLRGIDRGGSKSYV